MRTALTSRQRDFTAAIVSLTRQRGGIAPTLAELAAELDVSLSRASQLADACQARGVVAREKRIARSIRVVKPTKAGS